MASSAKPPSTSSSFGSFLSEQVGVAPCTKQSDPHPSALPAPQVIVYTP
jgi:hypothetical protein